MIFKKTHTIHWFKALNEKTKKMQHCFSSEGRMIQTQTNIGIVQIGQIY